jgi:alpha-glucosidase (family GH31 glycosyl hydrolase)
MRNAISRRQLLTGISATVGWRFTARFAFSELLIDAPPSSVPVGPAGMQLTIRSLNQYTLRLSIAAIDEDLDRFYDDGSTIPHRESTRLSQKRADAPAQTLSWGQYQLNIDTKPLRVAICRGQGGDLIQQLTFRPDINQIEFVYSDAPVYGLGPGSHPLDQRGTVDKMRNGAGDNLRILGARNPIPWLLGKGWGLYFHEPEGAFDLTGETGVFHPGDVARGQDIYLIVAATPAELLRQYAEITGYPHLPALWSFGFQQSHRTLDSRAQIIDEAKTFREKRLPCDTLIYLGTGFCPSGWNTGHGSFVFNETVFPDPEAMLREFHQMHFKAVLHVVNPPEDLHGDVSDSGSAAAEPGDAAHYWQQHVPFVQMGVDGWWPDEGDVLPTPSRLARNRMYWKGGRLSRPDRRPFALHRNCYAGIQRWGWLWSGDTFSTWKTLETQIMMGINAGLNGVPYWGTDIGGFVPTKEFTAELFVRWFQFGAFCPSFRCHGRTWQLRRPWGWNVGSYGPSEMGPEADAFLPKPADLHHPEVEPICRKYLNTRYQLLPYIYSAARETHTTGLPLIRSLGLAFPEDAKAWATVDSFLFGPSLLAAPVYEQGADVRTLYLPQGAWYDFWTSKRMEGGQDVSVAVVLGTMPLFVRTGSILPTGPIKQYADEPSSEPLRLTIYPGADGKFLLYDDDGISFAYERGDFSVIDVEWNDGQRLLHLRPAEGHCHQVREFAITLAGSEPNKAKNLVYNGKAITTSL